jgi:Ca2+-binding RTX toxin-like protein
MVTLTVSDGHGHSDLVNFIFYESGTTGSTVTLTGTSEKDVIFATGHDDILTGGAKADQFVFTQEYGPSNDTVTDFTAGQDHIDLRDFAADVNTDNIDSWLASSAHVSQQGFDTLITLDNGGTITLQNVTAGNLHATDFIVSHPVFV